MLIGLSERNESTTSRMARLGIPMLLVGLGVVTLGFRMSRMLDSGSTSLWVFPINEFLCGVFLGLGSVLVGGSIVFNVVGARYRNRS